MRKRISLILATALLCVGNLVAQELSHNLTIGESKYASLMLAFNAAIPEGVKAYVATSVSDGYVYLSEVEGNVIAASTPVMLKAEAAGDYAFVYTEESAAAVGDNLLEGVLFNKSVSMSSDYNYYVFDEGVCAWLPAAAMEDMEDCFSATANTAYLQVPTTMAESYSSLLIATVTASGTCGENLTWQLTDAGELTIEGSGAMSDYASSSSARPWHAYITSIKIITIGSGVTSIGTRAFLRCGILTSIDIPKESQLTSIGDYAFSGCKSLTSITLPEDVTGIGAQAFYQCTNLTSVTLPKESQLTSIGMQAFQNCTGLTAITLPEDVKSIGKQAFLYCTGLASITIEGMTSIGQQAFALCTSLASVACKALIPPTISSDAFYNVNKSIPVYVPAGSVEAYKSAEGWSAFTNIQPITASVTINQYGSATYCSEYALDFGEVKGLKAYAATGYNPSTGVITLTRVMTAKPGIGLFLKGEPGEYTVPTLESTDDNSLNMLVGTLESTAVNSTSDDGLYYNYRYTIKEGDEAPLFYRVDDGYTLGAGKAYLQIPVAWMPTEAQAISLRFNEGGTTDIEDVESTDNGEADIYDLMGRRVANPQKGMVYIVNGKKIIW